jgi:hypothetical protein
MKEGNRRSRPIRRSLPYTESGSRSDAISFRAPDSDRNIVDAAASYFGMSRSEFYRSAGLQRAGEIFNRAKTEGQETNFNYPSSTKQTDSE